jgi:hypothetical protein
MSRARLVVTAAATMVVALLAPVRPATACTCAQRELSEYVATASTVFLGTVVTSGSDGTTFDVSRVFKGDGPGSAPIANGGAAAGCAVPFVEGRRYVVFAALQNDALSTDICAGTTNDLSIVSRLSVGASPSARAAPTIVKVVTTRTIPIAAAAAMAALVAAAALVAVRAGKRPRPIA